MTRVIIHPLDGSPVGFHQAPGRGAAAPRLVLGLAVRRVRCSGGGGEGMKAIISVGVPYVDRG